MLLTKETHHTKEDYERLPEGVPYQLIGGELIMSPSPTFFHQEIIGNILEKLRPFVRKNKLGYLVVSPLDVHLSDIDIYQPDLLFIGKENGRAIDPNDRIHFAPDLVIEVLSPSTAIYDYSRKKAIYCEHGVKEYWIVDPLDETVEIMENDGRVFLTVALLRTPATLESQMFPGFTMKIEEIFAR